MGYEDNYRFWQTRLAGTEHEAGLRAYEHDQTARENAFYQYLEFGTAGMRGVLGLGANMMNLFTVRRSTQGLADYIKQNGRAQDGVVIAYDSRLNSALFARETALTLAAGGVKAYLYDKLTSVPQLSFSVLQLGCAAGVVITASHNPAKYNGYKVYGADGGQLSGADAEAVTACINRIDDPFAIHTMEETTALAAGLLVYVGEELEERYLAQVKTLSLAPKPAARHASALKVVYTPLHGTGLRPVTRVLRDLGFDLYLVAEQSEPDGNFPTVSAPNPENPEAFTLAFAKADQVGADLVLATDPDCDRLGVAVRRPDRSFIVLTGNQIGCLLLEYILSRLPRAGAEPRFAVKSIVSTPLADRIAAAHGVEMRSVLTGFKYIAEQIKLSQESGRGEFVFGFEESYGFLRGDFVRDKDACIAAMLVAEMSRLYAARGMSLYDGLVELYETYGWYAERVLSFTREGASGLAAIKRVVSALRATPPTEINGRPVLAVSDYQAGTRYDVVSGALTRIDLPASDVLCFELPCGSVIVRPSGTEPKLKAYVFVAEASGAAAAASLDALCGAVEKLVTTRL